MGATGRDIHVDKLLSEMAIGYRPSGAIADMIFPVIKVQKQSDLYTVFDRADRLRRQDTKRTPGARAKRVIEDIGSNTYFAMNYALAGALTIEDRANADPGTIMELAMARTETLLDHLILDWEVRVATQVTSTTNVGSSAAVSSAWNGAGAPLTDVNAAIDNVHYANGMMPNNIVFGVKAWDSFRRDSTIRNLIFGTNNGGGYPNAAQVAQLLNVPNVHIGGMFQNTANKGQSESLGTIWGDNVLVYYAPDAPTRERPSFAYSLRWAAPGLPNMQVERHPYDSRTKSEEIEVGYYQDEKITGASYGFLLTAVNSST